MKVGIIQQRNSGDVKANRQSLISKIKQLASQGAQLVVLPELHDSLYFCQVESVDNFDLAVEIPGEVTREYAAVARECGIVLVTSLFEKRATGLYHNNCTTTRQTSMTPTEAWLASTARCTSPTTLPITRNSISPPATRASSPSRRRWASWA